jgi:hypothetical protein
VCSSDLRAFLDIAIACQRNGAPEEARQWVAAARGHAQDAHSLVILSETLAALGDTRGALDLASQLCGPTRRTRIFLNVADRLLAERNFENAGAILAAAEGEIDRSEDVSFREQARMAIVRRLGTFDAGAAIDAALRVDAIELRRVALVGLLRPGGAEGHDVARRVLRALASLWPLQPALSADVSRAARRLIDAGALDLAEQAAALIPDDAGRLVVLAAIEAAASRLAAR